MFKKTLNGAIVIAAASILLIATNTWGATVKLPAIKPAAKQAVPAMTDEQQSIESVRRTKAAVVSIVGSSKVPLQRGGFTLQPVDSSFGTGFIIESNGYIVSNNHVVSDSNATYSVILLDGKKFPATVVGVDRFSDIALLKIEAGGLATVTFGNSDALETGQSVFAIGNALGRYQNTVTRGVVSGLGRDIGIGTDYNPTPRLQNLIQTDAAINPGNSGGPLINLAGEVVGMNTLIDTSGSGLGFAIPANTIRDTVQQLKTVGKASHPYLGITYQTVDSAVRAVQNWDQNVQGAFITSVTPNGPAARAGILPGDIITSVNGNSLNENNELDKVVQRFPAGSQVTVVVSRSGQVVSLTVVLGEYPS